jgi:hypothetical protein
MIRVGKGPKVYELGCRFEFLLSGLLLGEGDHHGFQLHFKDEDAWAVGSYELGKSWHGPYVSNNIRPYVRPTAPKNMTLYEDDNTTFFDLNNIFEDTDIQEELNFTIAVPIENYHNAEWKKTYSDDNLNIEIVNETRLRIDLVPNQFGESMIWINVTDKNNFYLEIPYEFKIIIIPINDPPQIIKYFDYLIMQEDQVNTEINLYDHFDDPIDLDELEFRASNYQNIQVSIDEFGDVTLTSKADWYGDEYIDFFASDGEEEVTDFLKVIVQPVNDEPLLLLNQTKELWQDQWDNFTINVFDSEDNDSVIISHDLPEIFPELVNSPEKYGYSFDNNTGYLTFKPTNSMVGTYEWNVSATDVDSKVNYSIIELIIHNVNDPPVPKIIFPESGARYLTTDKISFRGTVHDPDRTLKDIEFDPISFTWFSTLHSEKKQIGSNSILEPDLYDAGTHTITLVVDDGEYARNTTIVIHVFEIDPNLDTDGDGIPDYWENLFSLSILDPIDADDDFDTDMYSNWEEYKAQTDPRNPSSIPDKHYYRDTSEEEDLTLYLGFFFLLIVVMIILVLFMLVKVRRKRREDEEAAKAEKDAAKIADEKGAYGKYKAPKVACHVCGASYEIMTLNRPVAVTCNQCNSRGVVY